jgi:zinc transporter 9
VENLTPHPPHPAGPGPNSSHSHSHTHPHAHSHDDEAAQPILPKDPEDCETHAAAHGLSATLGLVIHGAADGIAIGASSLTGNAKLSMVVFIAVIVHKGTFVGIRSFAVR